MSWYKCEARHGPGHQSHSVFYEWYDKPLSKEEKKFLFEDVFGDKEWPIGGIRAVGRLPEKVRQNKINLYKSKIDEAQKMLKLLRNNKEKA